MIRVKIVEINRVTGVRKTSIHEFRDIGESDIYFIQTSPLRTPKGKPKKHPPPIERWMIPIG